MSKTVLKTKGQYIQVKNKVSKVINALILLILMVKILKKWDKVYF